METSATCSDGFPAKEGDHDPANWQWAGTLVVHEVYQREDGTLGIKPPHRVAQTFLQEAGLTSMLLTLSSQDSCVEARLIRGTGNLFKFEAEIVFSKNTCSFGLRLFKDETTGDEYEFIFNVILITDFPAIQFNCNFTL